MRHSQNTFINMFNINTKNDVVFLSYYLLNAILLPSKFVYFNENLQCCYGHPHDVTCYKLCNVWS